MLLTSMFLSLSLPSPLSGINKHKKKVLIEIELFIYGVHWISEALD